MMHDISTCLVISMPPSNVQHLVALAPHSHMDNHHLLFFFLPSSESSPPGSFRRSSAEGSAFAFVSYMKSQKLTSLGLGFQLVPVFSLFIIFIEGCRALRVVVAITDCLVSLPRENRRVSLQSEALSSSLLGTSESSLSASKTDPSDDSLDPDS